MQTVAQFIKNLPTMQETPVQFLGWEDPLEKRKGYPLQYSGLENSLDCKPMRSKRVRGNWATFTFNKFPGTALCRAPLSVEFSSQEHWSALHFLLQGIFLTQGLNLNLLCFLHWQVGSFQLVCRNDITHHYIISIYTIIKYVYVWYV